MSAASQSNESVVRIARGKPGGEGEMRKLLLTSGRLIALVVAYIVLFTVATQLTTPPEASTLFTPEQMKQAAAALPLASALMALMLAYLAVRSRWRGLMLAGVLFVIFYVIYTFLSWVELLAFPAVSSQMPAGTLNGMLMQGLIIGIPFSLLTVWILGKWRGGEPPENGPLRYAPPEWVGRLLVGAVLYVVVYFTFGYFVAWRTPGLPAFYGGVDPGTFPKQLASVWKDTPWLYGVAMFRGMMWAAVGAIIVQMHKGKPWEAMLATGAAFDVLMNASLLFPNPYFPPAVGRAHTIELLSSNLLYGILLAGWLLWRSGGNWRAKAS
jgi:hypothetical protein